MAKNRNTVHVILHKDYFDKVFEPNRRSFARQVGLPDISQVKFTEYLSKNNMPKLNLNLFPKRRTRFRL